MNFTSVISYFVLVAFYLEMTLIGVESNRTSLISPLYRTQEQFEFISLLGKGGKSEVFLAKDTLGHFKAIKKMYSKEQLTGKYPQEYLNAIFASDGSSLIADREFLIGQQLNHPNILKIDKLFTDTDIDGHVHTYLVMEFVNGKTLGEIPHRSQQCEEAIQNTLQLIDALKHAFTHYFIHNDLYSSNIMFDDACQIKLIDLDSFDELTAENDAEEDRTNQEYIEGLLITFKNVLACGDFEDEELQSIISKMQALKNKEAYSGQMNRLISYESATFFILFLEDVAGLIRSHSQI